MCLSIMSGTPGSRLVRHSMGRPDWRTTAARRDDGGLHRMQAIGKKARAEPFGTLAPQPAPRQLEAVGIGAGDAVDRRYRCVKAGASDHLDVACVVVAAGLAVGVREQGH